MSDIRFYHFRVGGGVITAYTHRKIDEGTVALGFAMCSPKDQFNKAFGRKVSLGRGLKKPVIVKYSGNTYNDVRNYIKSHYRNFPSWLHSNLIELGLPEYSIESGQSL